MNKGFTSTIFRAIEGRALAMAVGMVLAEVAAAWAEEMVQAGAPQRHVPDTAEAMVVGWGHVERFNKKGLFFS